MTDLEVYQPKAPAVIPASGLQDTDSWITVVRDIIKIADVIYDTPFVPDGLRGSSPAVAAAMLAGREMGLGIMTSLANIDVIRGKPTQKALLMRAMILSRGHRWADVDVTDTRAVVRGCRKGESEWTEVTFTADQAKRAGLDLGKYPADKLYARATSRLARRKFADVIMGMPYSSEELEDGEVPGDGEMPAAAQNGNGHEPKASPRTARRKTAAAGDDTQGQRPGAGDSTAREPAPRAAGAASSRGAQPLPPLPGEDEPDPTSPPDATSGTPATGGSARPATPTSSSATPTSTDEHGTERHRKLVGAVQGQLKRLGFAIDDDDREERVITIARLAQVAWDPDNHTSTNDFEEDELKAAADTLARCKNRGALDALLKAGEVDG